MLKVYDLNKMKKGWFVGDFEPNVIWSKDFEVAVKEYKKGDKEDKHYHKVSIEITVIVKGKVRMFDQEYSSGSIIEVKPYEATAFEALDDTICVVVKVPSSKGDKFICEI